MPILPIPAQRLIQASLLLTCAAAAASEGSADDRATRESMLAPLATQSLVLDIAAANDRAVAVGERGHILLSESRTDWRQVVGPTQSMLTAVTAVGNKVWAVGHDQVILHSTDGGLNWSMQHHDTAEDSPLLDVLFLDAERGIAIGAYGQYLTTTDGGATWNIGYIGERSRELPAQADDTADSGSADDEDSWLVSTDIGEEEGDPHLNAIVRTSGGLLIVAEAGAAYRSSNDGESWTKLSLPYAGSMFGAVALDDDSVIAFGLRGNVFRSTDLGNTWETVDSGTEASFFGGYALSGGRAILVGAGGTIALMRNGSSQLRLLEFSEGGTLAAVLAISDVQFVLGGDNGIATYQPN